MLSSFVWLTAAGGAWANRPRRCLHERAFDHGCTFERPEGRNCTCFFAGLALSKDARCDAQLGAECAAFSTGLEHYDLLCVMWGELCGDLTKLDQHESYLQGHGRYLCERLQGRADALLNACAGA